MNAATLKGFIKGSSNPVGFQVPVFSSGGGYVSQEVDSTDKVTGFTVLQPSYYGLVVDLDSASSVAIGDFPIYVFVYPNGEAYSGNRHTLQQELIRRIRDLDDALFIKIDVLKFIGAENEAREALKEAYYQLMHEDPRQAEIWYSIELENLPLEFMHRQGLPRISNSLTSIEDTERLRTQTNIGTVVDVDYDNTNLMVEHLGGASPSGYLGTPDSLEELAGGLVEYEEGKMPPNFSAFVDALDAHLEAKDGVDDQDISSTGWGVIFSTSTPAAVVEALAPLLEHRRAVAARFDENGYREFRGVNAYRPGETAADFLHRAIARSDGLMVPEVLPYYLLLVGTPEEIPFSFQYELDIEFAVGRIWFETAEEYLRYALAVVVAERGEAVAARHGVFFAPSHGDGPNRDLMTELSAERLTRPLARNLEEKYGGAKSAWSFETVTGETATKERLAEIVERREAPALLFTAGHGVALPNDHRRQREDQGAVICHDWAGPSDTLGSEHYFAAGDLSAATDLRGSIIFQFACFSAGTPRQDDSKVIYGDYLAADAPFLARLPQRLLAPPEGRGALAFIGHIDRVWTHSPLSGGFDEHDRVIYEQTLGRILEGYPVGHAMEYFNRRYAQQAVKLANWQDRIRRQEEVDLKALAKAWLVHNDVRNFILIGDPAVRLATTER